MRIVGGFCIREVMDEIVAIPTGEAAQKFSGIISLNPVSKLLFECLNEDQNIETLTAVLLEEYEVDAGDAAAPDRLKADDYLWQRVNVVAGSYARNIRRRTPNGQDFEILIELPERNTIKL